MPVTTRAAALKFQSTGNATPVVEQTASNSTSTTISVSKSDRKRRLPKGEKQSTPQASTPCCESNKSPGVEQQLSVSKNGFTLDSATDLDHENKDLEKEIGMICENSSADLQLVLSPQPSSPDGNQTNQQLTSEKPTTTSTETKGDDHSINSLVSSNDEESYINSGDSNAFLNKPVVKDDIITGTSTRGGKMIFMSGYAYLYMSTSKETIGWRCAKRNENCKAVIHTSKTTGVFSHWNGAFHSHVVDLHETRKRGIMEKIKNRVLDEYIPIKIIIEEEYRRANLSAEEKRAMPLPGQIESGLHKLRRKALPPLPWDQKFVIPPVYQQTYSNQPFLIYDKRKSDYGGRLIIFSSDEQLDVLFHSDTLFADGTFKVSPKLFEQLYVIHGVQHGETVPVCFILTSNRRHDTYEAIFRCLKRLGLRKGVDLTPTTIVCDFEQAFINAVAEELPETVVTGCWFHLCQACYRNIQELGLMKLYESDPELRHLCRSFMGLALLPIDLISEGFEILKEKASTSSCSNQLESFVSYFKKEWMDHFKPSSWSVSDSRWRTNNVAEAQNRRFFSRVVQPHPNLWRFIQCLKQEESVISHRMAQTELGFTSNKVTRSTRAAARKSRQIEKLIKLLRSNNRSLSDTVKSLAYLVGEPVGEGKKGKKKKNNISKSDSSCSSVNLSVDHA